MKTKPRNPNDVIAAMLEHVPVDQKELREALMVAAHNARYKAPEQHQEVIIGLAPLLGDLMGYPPDCEWKQAVADIFEDRGAWRVFYLNDCEWWMGRSLVDVVNAACKEYDLPAEDVADEPYELSPEEMQQKVFLENCEGEGITRTFQEELDRRVNGGSPRVEMFATTEF